MGVVSVRIVDQPLDQSANQLALVREVIQQPALGHPSLIGDGLQGQCLWAASGQHLLGGVEQFVASFPSWH